jgi:hypothetical protein
LSTVSEQPSPNIKHLRFRGLPPEKVRASNSPDHTSAQKATAGPPGVPVPAQRREDNRGNLSLLIEISNALSHFLFDFAACSE